MYFKMKYENWKFGSLFNDAFPVNRLHSVDDNSYVNDELKGLGKKRLWTKFKVLEGLRKATKPSTRIAGRRGPESNPEHPEYEVGVLTTRPRRSVTYENRTNQDTYFHGNAYLFHTFTWV
jgi:hypothetical protein